MYIVPHITVYVLMLQCTFIIASVQLLMYCREQNTGLDELAHALSHKILNMDQHIHVCRFVT